MGDSQGKNQYIIPWGRIILTTTIVIIIILVVAAPAIVMFTAIVKDYSPVVKPALILMLLLGFLFFLKIRCWTNLMYYPITAWVYNNLMCQKCGQPFEICEPSMKRPGSFASFICYCGNCEKAALVETGTFNRILTPKQSGRIAHLYEKAYQGKAYKLPLSVWLTYIALTAAPPLILILGPVLIFVGLFGPNPAAAAKFRSIQGYLFYTLLLLFDLLYWKSKKMRDFVTYPIRRWILNNVKCPKCENSLARCKTKRPALFFDFFKYNMLYLVICKECKSQRSMEIGGVDNLLMFG